MGTQYLILDDTNEERVENGVGVKMEQTKVKEREAKKYTCCFPICKDKSLI